MRQRRQLTLRRQAAWMGTSSTVPEPDIVEERPFRAALSVAEKRALAPVVACL